MLNQIKRVALNAMQQSGFKRVLGGSRWRSQRLLILGYHGLSQSDEHVWNPELYLSAEAFRSHLQMLKDERIQVLPLAEGLKLLYDGRLPPRALCLTFDDGTVDFHRIAQPILREFGYPATVYLTTYYCFRNLPVFPPALNYILWKGRSAGAAPYPTRLGIDEPMNLATAAGRDLARRQIWGFAEERDLPAGEKHDLLREVASVVGYDFEAMLAQRVHHLMTPDEVAGLSRQGVDIQLHAHRHRRPLNRDLYRREISENRALIEQITGRTPVHFCYPSGRTHPDFLGWLREEGVKSATTCKAGIASRQSNPLLLPRLICDSNVRPLELSSWLAGTAALLPRRRHTVQHWEPNPPDERRGPS